MPGLYIHCYAYTPYSNAYAAGFEANCPALCHAIAEAVNEGTIYHSREDAYEALMRSGDMDGRIPEYRQTLAITLAPLTCTVLDWSDCAREWQAECAEQREHERQESGPWGFL